MFAQDSIELLQSSGIDFEKFEHLGIDVQVHILHLSLFTYMHS